MKVQRNRFRGEGLPAGRSRTGELKAYARPCVVFRETLEAVATACAQASPEGKAQGGGGFGCGVLNS